MKPDEFEFDPERELWVMRRRTFLFLSGAAAGGLAVSGSSFGDGSLLAPVFESRGHVTLLYPHTRGFARPVPLLFDATGNRYLVGRKGAELVLGDLVRDGTLVLTDGLTPQQDYSLLRKQIQDGREAWVSAVRARRAAAPALS